MSTLAEKKAAAKAAARKFQDVVVSLDAGLSAERNELMQQVTAAKNTMDPRLTAVPDTSKLESRIAAIEAAERDSLTTVRVYALPPLEWVKVQKDHGFDLTGTCLATLPEHARVLDGNAEVTQSAEEWSELFTLTSAPDVTAVLNAVYELNVSEPANRLERVKNSSEVATASAKK